MISTDCALDVTPLSLIQVEGKVVSSIGPGLLCLIGLADGDGEADVEYILKKILTARLWGKVEGGGKAWEESVSGKGYEILCVSQFTVSRQIASAF